MVKFQADSVDAIFSALADPTRRAIVARLVTGKASISDLARPHAMSLPAVLKHVNVLSEAGLVVREKSGRTVTCRLNPDPLDEARRWLDEHLAFWNARLDALDALLTEENDP